MLNGLDPVIIFQIRKLNPLIGDELASIPLVSKVPSLIEMPPIPIYLSEQLTGLYIDTEDKNVDIETVTDTLTNGAPPDVNQRGIANTIEVNIFAKKSSLGLALISAMIDLCFDKVSSKEYAISYIHGPIIVFGGLIAGFSINQNAGDDLAGIRLTLTKGTKTPTPAGTVPTVPMSTGPIPVGVG